MRRSLRIHAIEEVVTGSDRVLGNTLRAARLNMRLSRGGLAAQTGIQPTEIDHLEAGRLGTFASPERARLVVLAYCDGVGIDPGPALARLEPYARRQLLLPPSPASRNSGFFSTMSAIVVAGLVAWQAATLFADAGDETVTAPAPQSQR